MVILVPFFEDKEILMYTKQVLDIRYQHSENQDQWLKKNVGIL